MVGGGGDQDWGCGFVVEGVGGYGLGLCFCGGGVVGGGWLGGVVLWWRVGGTLTWGCGFVVRRGGGEVEHFT